MSCSSSLPIEVVRRKALRPLSRIIPHHPILPSDRINSRSLPLLSLPPKCDERKDAAQTRTQRLVSTKPHHQSHTSHPNLEPSTPPLLHPTPPHPPARHLTPSSTTLSPTKTVSKKKEEELLFFPLGYTPSTVPFLLLSLSLKKINNVPIRVNDHPFLRADGDANDQQRRPCTRCCWRWRCRVAPSDTNGRQQSDHHHNNDHNVH